MISETFDLIATSAFGLEGLISSELKRMNIKEVKPENGFVRFRGNMADAFLCNLRSRFADRIMILLAEEKIKSFEDLFVLIKHIPWEEYMSGTEKINISCKCARSQLMSARDCQSVSKKAVIERLKEKTRRTVFPESGIPFPIHLNLHNDLLRVSLDTSGEGLSRRGYRTWNGEAPLRETLASALVECSPWRPGMPLYDPCCGTGTLLIEAAMRASHRAPGIKREFAMSGFAFTRKNDLDDIRKNVWGDFQPDRVRMIEGSDIDPSAVCLAEKHIAQAGLDGCISVNVLPLQEVNVEYENGVFLCNPPYGERLGDRKSCHALYRDLSCLQQRHSGWSLCAISSDPDFERAYGRKADKRRRFYNGTLECVFYTYLAK